MLSEENTALAQLAAEINDALGTGLTHFPKNPGWPEDKYQRAALGARSCSLDFGKGMTAVEVVDSLMDDSDMTNVDRLGHRRNLLNPRSQKTGFGNGGSIQAMYAVDQSGPRFKGHFVAFPPPGPIPVAFIHSEENEGIAWTFSMNPKFLSCPKSGFKVKVFELDAMNDRVRVLDTKLVSRSSFGNLYPAVIFRPVGLEVAPGKKYRVEIWGLHAGRDVEVGPGGEVAYTVSFFEMKDPFARYYIDR